MPRKYNYLITGGLGFIGSNIAKLIIKKKNLAKCILVDNYSGYINPLRRSFSDFRKLRFNELNDKQTNQLIKKKCIFERSDCTDFKSIFKIIQKYKPDIIFHTAAIPVARIQNPNVSEFRTGSIDSTINLLDCVDMAQQQSNYKLQRFLYISSSMIYGDFKKNKAFETDDPNPKEIYGTMKLAGEIIVKGLSNANNIPYTIVRPSAVYGPTDMNERVTQYLIVRALHKEKLIVHGKNEKLDFTYVQDLAEGCIKAAENKKGKNNIFNLTFGNSRKILDYAKILNKYFPSAKIKIQGRDKKRPKRGTLSTLKASKMINFYPKFNLEKGAKIYIDFYKKFYKKKS